MFTRAEIMEFDDVNTDRSGQVASIYHFQGHLEAYEKNRACALSAKNRTHAGDSPD